MMSTDSFLIAEKIVKNETKISELTKTLENIAGAVKYLADEIDKLKGTSVTKTEVNTSGRK